jgi:hypothetical protein
MLKQFNDRFTYAKSPYTRFDKLGDPRHAFGENPVELIESTQSLVDIRKMLDGREILVKQIYSSTNSEYTEARTFDLRFPEASREFVSRLYSQLKRGETIAFGTVDTLETEEGRANREVLKGTSTNDYWYTAWGPFDRHTLKLYDGNGTLVYQHNGSTGDTNILSFTLQPEKGRIWNNNNNSVPWGELKAEYNPVIYGEITDMQPGAEAGFNPTKFAPSITVREIRPWPIVSAPVTRLYLRNTTWTGSEGPTPPLAGWTDTGEFGATKNTIKSLSTTKGSSVQNVEASHVYTVDGTKYAYAGTWISSALAQQTIPLEVICQVAAGLKGNAAFERIEDPLLLAYVYIWRPRIGKVATLLDQMTRSNTGAVGGGQPGAPMSDPAWQVCTGAAIQYAVDIEENDVLVVELWDSNIASAGNTEVINIYWDGTSVDSGQYRTDASPASFIEFSHPIYFKQ